MEGRIAPISREELGLFLASANDTLAYNLPLWIPLGKSCGYDKAKKALEKILEAHPALNTQFFMKEGDVPFDLEKG